MSHHPHQRGVAIILVMLIVAIATVLATYLAQQQQLWQRQVESQFDRAQARHLGIAGIDWARAVLADDASANLTDHSGEIWALRLPAMPVDQGEVIGIIEDRQGLFNLNNLVRNGQSSAPDIAQFQRLLVLLGLPGELSIALADWMDSDSDAQYPGGAEDVYYLSLAMPCRSANRPLAEIGELAVVKGFDLRSIERLRPFVSVLPLSMPINVNFAPAEVLAAVIPEMKLSDARVLVQERHSRPFKDINDFTERLPKGSNSMNNNDLSVKSSFFWVTGRARVGHSQVTTQALLQRTGGWTLVMEGHNGFLRTSLTSGLALDCSDQQTPPLALTLSLNAAADHPPGIIELRFLPAEPPGAFPAWELPVPLIAGKVWDWRNAPINPATPNLLCGDFSPSLRLFDAMSKLRPVLFILIAACLIEVVGTHFEWLKLAGEKQALMQTTEHIFRAAFGDEVTLVDAPLQMQRNLTNLRHAAGVADDSDFISLLDRITPLHGTPVLGLNYEPGRLELDIKQATSSDLNKLEKNLKNNGLKVRISDRQNLADGIQAKLNITLEGL